MVLSPGSGRWKINLMTAALLPGAATRRGEQPLALSSGQNMSLICLGDRA